MQRKVECQSISQVVTVGRGSTPDGGAIAPDVEKTEVVVLFYDADELASQRNAYPMTLTPEEAKGFKVGKNYTLTIE